MRGTAYGIHSTLGNTSAEYVDLAGNGRVFVLRILDPELGPKSGQDCWDGKLGRYFHSFRYVLCNGEWEQLLRKTPCNTSLEQGIAALKCIFICDSAHFRVFSSSSAWIRDMYTFDTHMCVRARVLCVWPWGPGCRCFRQIHIISSHA